METHDGGRLPGISLSPDERGPGSFKHPALLLGAPQLLQLLLIRKILDSNIIKLLKYRKRKTAPGVSDPPANRISLRTRQERAGSRPS
jgi:hypothetical protein